MVTSRLPTLAAACPASSLGPLEPQTWLDPAQHGRWRRLHHRRDRDAFLAARVLAAQLWALIRNQAAEDCGLRQHCEQCGGPHGRPDIPGDAELSVSWSHSGPLVAAVVGPEPVAIDVETGTTPPPASLTGAIGTEEGLRRWSLAECWTKAGYTDLEAGLHLTRQNLTPRTPAGLPPASALHTHFRPVPAGQGTAGQGTAGHVMTLSRGPVTLLPDLTRMPPPRRLESVREW
ncbi:MAG: hypothetical protein ACTH3G_12330 [Citricoccus sp.]